MLCANAEITAKEKGNVDALVGNYVFWVHRQTGRGCCVLGFQMTSCTRQSVCPSSSRNLMSGTVYLAPACGTAAVVVAPYSALSSSLACNIRLVLQMQQGRWVIQCMERALV